jgi:putative tryptophan/tyrosine transport system substrate-binding protein
MIGRRALLRGLGVALLGVPLRAAAQPAGRIYRIGFLGGASAPGYASLIESFIGGLRDLGYVPGRNVSLEYRWADGQYDRLPGLAAELARLKVDVIVTQGTPAAFAAKGLSPALPVVMAIVGNPVESGLVASLARPGGNVTGSSYFMDELNAKRLELIKMVIPGLGRAGVLINPGNPAMASVLREMEQRAQALKVSIQPVKVQHLDELDGVLQATRKQIEALTVVEEGLFVANAPRVAEAAARHRIPSIGFGEYCEAGGLMAYGVDFPYIWRQSAALVDKVLKGAKPADLPIQQATRFEFVINLKAAKTLGIMLSPEVRARADRVLAE